MNHIARQAR